MELGHWDSHREVIEANFLKIGEHHTALHLFQGFGFEALKTFICLFDVLEEANIIWVELQRRNEVNLRMLNFAKIVACRATPSDALYVIRID